MTNRRPCSDHVLLRHYLMTSASLLDTPTGRGHVFKKCVHGSKRALLFGTVDARPRFVGVRKYTHVNNSCFVALVSCFD